MDRLENRAVGVHERPQVSVLTGEQLANHCAVLVLSNKANEVPYGSTVLTLLTATA